MPPLEDEDSDLFRRSVGDIKRLRTDTAEHDLPRPAPAARFRRMDEAEVLRDSLEGNVDPSELETGDELCFRRPMIRPADFKRLRRGQFSVGSEIDLHLPALIPDDYLPDVHARLVLYKRIASASSVDELRELQVEMIDRFGLLPEPLKNLIGITELKLRTTPLGIKKLEAGPAGGRILFGPEPRIDPTHLIRLIQTKHQAFKLDGGDKLRFFADLEEPRHRLDRVQRVLDQVTGQGG